MASSVGGAASLARGRGMAMSLLVLAVLLASVDLSSGAVYKVGDSIGWTVIGNPNYTAWSSNKSFHLGDTLVFEYNNRFHNVMEVNRTEYRACNPSSPRTTYTTGNDSITLKRKGHYYFICGIPGHCALGQKVDIRVSKPSSLPSPSPSPSMSPSANGPAPSPHGSNASGGHKGAYWPAAMVTMALFIGLRVA